MQIGYKIKQENWKSRIVSAILTGIMYIFDYLLDGVFQKIT